MRNFILLFATLFATISFAQFEQGTWTFGAGMMFNTTASFEEAMELPTTVDVSYFVIDGLMVSLSLNGQNEVTETLSVEMIEYDVQLDEFVTVTIEEEVVIQEAEMNWSIGARYYVLPNDGLFAGAQATKVEWNETIYDSEGESITTDESGMNLQLHVGLSKELGFDGKLWFEPAFSLYMPAQMDGAVQYGLMSTFRFAF